jgi:tRNA(fMet)-specific endonuclease VapC
VIFIDTNVAIDLRDHSTEVGLRLQAITPSPVISLVSLIELEAGVERDQMLAVRRRDLLNIMLRAVEVAMLTREDVATYGRLVAALGFNRRLVLDRLIAAQSLNRGAALVTANAEDFADIPGLKLIAW